MKTIDLPRLARALLTEIRLMKNLLRVQNKSALSLGSVTRNLFAGKI